MKWNEIVPVLLMVAILLVMSFVIFWNMYHTYDGPPFPPTAKFSGTASGSTANLTFDGYFDGDEAQEFSVYNSVNIHYNDTYIGVFVVDSNKDGIIEFDWDGEDYTALFIDMDNDGLISEGDHLQLESTDGLPKNSTYEIYLYPYISS